MKRGYAWGVVMLMGLAGSTGIGMAAGDEGNEDAVRALERRVQALEQGLTNAPAGSAVAGPAGFSLNGTDNDFSLKLRGYVQAHGRGFIDDDAGTASDTFLLRRVRPSLEGRMGKAWGVRLMPDFGGGKTDLTDAYIDYLPFKAFQVRGGKFTPPFGMEQLQSSTDLRFVERGHSSSLTPSRDVGLQASGQPVKGLQYALGMFNGVVDGGNGDTDADDQKDAIGRLWVEPFAATSLAPLKGLGLGMAGSVGEARGSATLPALGSYKSPGQQTVFSFRSSTTNAADTVFADGDRIRYAPQAAWYWGPVSLLGEYVQSSHDVCRQDQAETIDIEAWQAAVAVVLTGENAGDRRIRPNHAFAPGRGHWGAIEWAARIGALDVEDGAFPTFADTKKSIRGMDTQGVALNWYLTDNVKASLDYEHTEFTGGSAQGDRPDEDVVLAQWQLVF